LVSDCSQDYVKRADDLKRHARRSTDSEVAVAVVDSEFGGSGVSAENESVSNLVKLELS
jgi:hypothetical protein